MRHGFMKVLEQIERIQRNCAVFTTAINITVNEDNQVIKQIEKSVQFKIKILDQVSVSIWERWERLAGFDCKSEGHKAKIRSRLIF